MRYFSKRLIKFLEEKRDVYLAFADMRRNWNHYRSLEIHRSNWWPEYYWQRMQIEAEKRRLSNE